MSNGEPESFIPYNEWQNAVSPPEDSAQNLHFPDSDEDGDHEAAHIADDAKHLDYSEHYSQQMSELFDGDANDFADESTSNILGNVIESDHEEEDEDEEFVYTGMDSSNEPVPYRDQLRDVLGQEHEEDLVEDAQEVVQSHIDDENEVSITVDDEPLVCPIHCSSYCAAQTGAGTS